MKSLIIFLAIFLLAKSSSSQTISLIENKDIPIKEATTLYIPKVTSPSKKKFTFKVNGLVKDEKLTVSFAVREGSADKGTDFNFLENQLLNREIKYQSDKTFDIEFDIKTLKERNFFIDMTATGTKVVLYKLDIRLNSNVDLVTNSIAVKQSIPDTTHWDVRLITGGNFDFFNGPKIKNFAGELNINIPDLIKIKDWPLGVQFGLFNYHYFQGDSSSYRRDHDYYYLNPQDAYRNYDTTRIVRRDYSVNSKVDYNIWGGFIEPNVRIATNEWAQIYLSLHLGALITTQTFTPNLKQFSTDTILHNPSQKPLEKPDSIYTRAVVPYSYRQATFYDFYYGLGLPLRVNIKNKLKFNVVTTMGLVRMQLSSIPDAYIYTERYVYSHREWRGFFLMKYQLITTIAPIDIAFGGEYRTVFGGMRYFTNYIGAVIKFDSLFKK